MKIKYLLLINMLLVFFANAKAQTYNLAPQQPISSFVGIEDLWALTVTTSPGGALTQCVITIDLYEQQTGKLVLTSKSSPFNLPGGPSNYNKYSMAPLKPINNTVYPNPDYANINQNGLIPAGNYNAVYSLLGINQQGQQVSSAIADMPFSIEILFPPTLLSPFNDDTIQVHNPTFTWAPAFSGAQRIAYDIIIVEQYDGQSPEQAVNANPAYYKQENLQTTTLPYPFAAQQLKTNQWYAWRIIARLGNTPASRSETWRFIIVEPKDDPCLPKPIDFSFKLQENLTGAYCKVKNGQLNFYFSEKYKTKHNDLHFKIYNVHNNVVASNKTIARSYQIGNNAYTLMLTQNDATLPKGFYMLEVYMEKDVKLYLRFELTKDINPCHE